MLSLSRYKMVNKQDLCSQGAYSLGQESHRATSVYDLFAGGNNKLFQEAQGRLNPFLVGRKASLVGMSRKEEKVILGEGTAYI